MQVNKFMKKGFIFLFLILLVVYISFPYLISKLFLGSEVSRDLLLNSNSPNGEYALSAYRVNGGATTDYSVEVYCDNGENNKKIYNAYHEDDVDIEWISDSEVLINDKQIDLSKNETFDSRNN